MLILVISLYWYQIVNQIIYHASETKTHFYMVKYQRQVKPARCAYALSNIVSFSKDDK